MYTKQSKKLIIMNILDILKKYTDEDHRLSQKDIVDKLSKDYDTTVMVVVTEAAGKQITFKKPMYVALGDSLIQ